MVLLSDLAFLAFLVALGYAIERVWLRLRVAKAKPAGNPASKS